MGQLLATAGGGRAEGANWWWPQEEAAGSSRLSYVSVGNGFPPLAKRLVERIQALEFVDMADLRPARGRSPTCPVAEGVRPRARSSPLCDPPWPGGGSGQEVGGGCSDVDHVFHDLHSCGGDEAPGYDA